MIEYDRHQRNHDKVIVNLLKQNLQYPLLLLCSLMSAEAAFYNKFGIMKI